MRLLRIETQGEGDGVIVNAHMNNDEFKQLSGDLQNIISFSADTINEPTRAIRTGARANHARYLLLPIKLRRIFKSETHDFENIKCGIVKNKDGLFVVFCLDNKIVRMNE